MSPHKWKAKRKFVLQALRDFGVGKQSLEESIIEEVAVLKDAINQHSADGLIIDPDLLLQPAVSNIISFMVFGNRFDYNDEKFLSLLTTMREIAILISFGSILDVYPSLKFIPGIKGNLKKILSKRDKAMIFIREKILEHRDTFALAEIRNFVDMFLASGKNRGEDASQRITSTEMFYMIIDLFGAGTETVNTTLEWALLYLCHYPQMQQKIHDELDKVTNSGQHIRSKHKDLLPYTNAFLLEVQRHATITPLAAPRATTEDVRMRNYDIPKGMQIFPALYCAHRDEKYFPRSDLFDPERWLDEQGTLVNNEAFNPFSMGVRSCLGEQLAKLELFLFFTGLLQAYTIHISGDLPPVDTAISSMTRAPMHFTVKMKERY